MSSEQCKASEEVTRKNITAITEYTKVSRELVRDLEKQVNDLKNMITQQNQTIEQLRNQVTMLIVQNYGN